MPTDDTTPSSNLSLLPHFHLTRHLSTDQAGRRITLLGTIHSQPAILLAERAAFSTSPHYLSTFAPSLTSLKSLGNNDIYSWFLANNPSPSSSSTTTPSEGDETLPPDYKLTLIHPSTPAHLQKYSPQPLHLVTETPHLYTTYTLPLIHRIRARGTLTWIHNILDGRTEQDAVLYRGHPGTPEGFVLLPDLNWDQKTVGSLHLLGIVERRDLWSVRDLRKGMVGWLRGMRERMVGAAGEVFGVAGDEVKCYVHYQPTYYHFHMHIVHVSLEAGATQATGKALGLENIISQLETMQGGPDAGMQDVSLTYTLGEMSELWEKIYGPLKEGREVDVESF